MVKSHAEIESWVKLDPSKRHVDVGHMRTVVRNEKIYFPVIATFPESQVDKPITLEAELELVTPDGKVTKLQLPGAKKCCIANRVDPRAPTTIVLEPVIDFTFDETDLGGKYKLRAKINNGKETAVSEEVFSLSP